MDNQNKETIAFKLILHAGNAKSKAMDAIYASRTGQFDKAESDLKEANQEMVLAHKSQTCMLFHEAEGIKCDMDVLLAHALDHLASAAVVCELAEEIILLRHDIQELKREVEKC